MDFTMAVHIEVIASCLVITLASFLAATLASFLVATLASFLVATSFQVITLVGHIEVA
jgi:hypothetical protein